MSLDVSKNTELTALYCYNNLIKTLDVRGNLKITEFYCYNNQLMSLDLSNNTSITSGNANVDFQKTTLKAVKTGDKYVVNLKKSDPKIDLSKITDMNAAGGIYDKVAGTITFDSIPAEAVEYNYQTGNRKASVMDVTVTIEEGSADVDGGGTSPGSGSTNTSGNSVGSPNTGDSLDYGMLMLFLSSAGVVLFYALKRRKI